VGTVEGRENFAGLISAIVSALPDLRNVEQDIIAERDIVSVRAVVEGTPEFIPWAPTNFEFRIRLFARIARYP